MTIGEKLTALRGQLADPDTGRKTGVSQYAFCKLFNRRFPEIKLKRARYSKWETDENLMEIPVLKALVTFYGITADELLFEHKKISLLSKRKTLQKQRL